VKERGKREREREREQPRGCWGKKGNAGENIIVWRGRVSGSNASDTLTGGGRERAGNPETEERLVPLVEHAFPHY